MTDVIAEPCTGVKDKACAGECPVDCIYEASGCSTPTPASASTVVPASPCARRGDRLRRRRVRGSRPSSPARRLSSSTSSARPAAPPRPARCPTTPTTSRATSPAGSHHVRASDIGSWPRQRWPGARLPGSPGRPPPSTRSPLDRRTHGRNRPALARTPAPHTHGIFIIPRQLPNAARELRRSDQVP
jgi:hypothetical protein